MSIPAHKYTGECGANPPRNLASAFAKLSDCLERARALASQANEIADRLEGPTPENPRGDKQSGIGVSMVAHAHDGADALSDALAGLQRGLNRISSAL